MDRPWDQPIDQPQKKDEILSCVPSQIISADMDSTDRLSQADLLALVKTAQKQRLSGPDGQWHDYLKVLKFFTLRRLNTSCMARDSAAGQISQTKASRSCQT
jgi:hypothetical protein